MNRSATGIHTVDEDADRIRSQREASTLQHHIPQHNKRSPSIFGGDVQLETIVTDGEIFVGAEGPSTTVLCQRRRASDHQELQGYQQ